MFPRPVLRPPPTALWEASDLWALREHQSLRDLSDNATFTNPLLSHQRKCHGEVHDGNALSRKKALSSKNKVLIKKGGTIAISIDQQRRPAIVDRSVAYRRRSVHVVHFVRSMHKAAWHIWYCG